MPELPAPPHRKSRERFLVILVTLMAMVANVPAEWISEIGVDRDVLIGVLGLLIVLALFLYLRVFFFLIYTVVILGANLPEEYATLLGVSRVPLLIALIVMVLGSIMNYAGSYVPTGGGVRARRADKDASKALLMAIEKRRLIRVKAILELDFDFDQISESGLTPLMRAAQLGDARIVAALLLAGASPVTRGPHGTAIECAQAAGHAALAQLIASSAVGTPTAQT